MLSLVRIWLAICLLRAGPQRLPASPYLVGLSLLLYGVTDVVVSLANTDGLTALAITVLDLGLLVGFVFLVLRGRGMLGRYQQTLSAMAGVGVIFGWMALPVLLMAAREPVPAVAGMLWLGLLFWSLAVNAHILRHALEVPFGLGLVLATLYAVTVFTMVQWLFPPAG